MLCGLAYFMVCYPEFVNLQSDSGGIFVYLNGYRESDAAGEAGFRPLAPDGAELTTGVFI